MTLRHSSATRRLSQDIRGVASVEIAVMLPVFVVLLAGAFHLYSMAQRSLSASQSARACVWDFALAHCDGARTQLCTGANPASGAAQPADNRSGIEDLASYPILGSFVESLFGVSASASATWTQLSFPAKTQQLVTVERHLVCAPVLEDWQSFVLSKLCDFQPQALRLKILGCK